MSKSWLDMSQDIRPHKGFWAPGGYIGKCVKCGADFIGDKRALECSACAYGDNDSIAAMFGTGASNRLRAVGREEK